MANRKNVDIQILPFTAGMHAGLSGSFVILDFPNPSDPSLAYAETATDSLFIQEAEPVQRYVSIFSHLNSASLQPHLTTRFIRQIMKDSESA